MTISWTTRRKDSDSNHFSLPWVFFCFKYSKIFIFFPLLSRLAHGSLKEVSGLFLFCDWLKDRGIRRVAVTNAPRKNAEQMIAALGLNSFFEHLIIGSECPRAKPFPDPYLAGLTFLGIAPENAFAVEVNICTVILFLAL